MVKQENLPLKTGKGKWRRGQRRGGDTRRGPLACLYSEIKITIQRLGKMAEQKDPELGSSHGQPKSQLFAEQALAKKKTGTYQHRSSTTKDIKQELH